MAAVAAVALVILAVAAPAAHADFEDFAIEDSSAELASTQAGAHSDFETRWTFTKNEMESFAARPGEPPEGRPWSSMRDLVTELPPGLLGDPTAYPTCDAAVFADTTFRVSDFCPVDSQVGVVEPGIREIDSLGYYRTPLINLEPPADSPDVVARLGFMAAIYPMFIDVRLDPKRGDALTATVANAPSVAYVTGAYTRFWADPADEVHDIDRMNWIDALFCSGACGGPVHSEMPPTAFMRNPTSCGPAEVGTALRSYQLPEGLDYDFAALPAIGGCESVPFEPTMSLAPTSSSASSSAGIDVSLRIPQDGFDDPDALASADLRKATVRLPKGVTLNASTANGLGSCNEEQIGVDRQERQIFDLGGRGAPAVLDFGGQSTARLPLNATAAQVGAALEALPNVAPGDLSLSGRRGSSWTVDFGGSFDGQDTPSISGVHSELQQLLVKAEGGSYTLSFEGGTTAPLEYDAKAPEVKAALEALPGIGAGELEVAGGVTTGGGFVTGPGRSFRIAFAGARAGVDAPPISATGSLTGAQTVLQAATLTDGGSPVSTHTVKQGGSLGFDDEAPMCPASSKVASGTIETPVLRKPLPASVYLASQGDNPFNSLFAGYLVARGQGVMLKVPAKFAVDPSTGQIVTTFDNNPQQPFSSLELHFKGGDRGLITTPEKCGTYASTYVLTPWSGTAPVEGASQFTIDENCGDKPFAPGFSAGSSNTLAGAFTDFATRVTRNPGSPAITGIAVDLPPGVTAKLAGIPYCSDAALAGVPSAAGSAAAQLASPSCPAASQVGKVVAGTGSGAPFYVQTGKVYLAGPYKGAPLSLAVVVPAQAGPFDLGNVTVRVPVKLDAKTAQVHAVSDPLPTMLQGVPLDLRDVRVLLDRSAFVLNPTSCEGLSTTGTISGAGGASANVSDRFQVGECAALGFKPRISLRLTGGTKRTQNPALTATLRPRPGDANIASLSVAFPKSEFLDQSHLKTICTRVQFAADQCPTGSVYGKVTAWTPLLDQPLSGNVYLRSSDHPLPDLVADLRGPPSQPIRLEAAGQIDTVRGGLRTTFDFMPDAPITRVVLKMKGGSKGLLQNSRDACGHAYRASAGFTAHNGRTLAARPKLQFRCRKHGKGRRHGHRKGH